MFARWKDGDWQLLSGGRLRVTDQGHVHCLVISDVQSTDAGHYVVKLTDHQHVESSTAKLSVVTQQQTTLGMCYPCSQFYRFINATKSGNGHMTG